MSSFNSYVLAFFYVFSIGLAFFVGKSFDTSQSNIPNQNTNTVPKINNQVFSKQTAEIRGIILSVNGSTISVQNNQNINSEFRVADSVYITGYENQKKVNGFKSPQQLELNKQAIIGLEKDPQAPETELSYRVISVSYMSTLPFVNLNTKPNSATPSPRVK